MTGIVALMCQQHVLLKDRIGQDVRKQMQPDLCGFVLAKIETLRYRNPTVERMAAENPIAMASHGFITAGKATPTATPPA